MELPERASGIDEAMGKAYRGSKEWQGLPGVVLTPQKMHLPGILVRYEPAPGIDPSPVVFDSPHSGYDYPGDFDHAVPRDVLRRAEDAFVDDLYEGAPDLGAGFLKALFPRAYIDPNRHEDEIDSDMLSEPWPRPVRASEKSEMGLGLIRRLIKGRVHIYDRPLTVTEIMARIESYHRPYYAELENMLESRVSGFGAVWHVNCHSMRTTGRKGGKSIPRDDFVLGDREGESCDPAFTEFVAECLRNMGYSVQINHPFKGAELIERFGRPLEGRHSLQIEVNRGLYMDEDRIEKHAGFGQLKGDIDQLIGDICKFAKAQVRVP
ncbi:N-formylglutamate amidohydrolase [Dongia mobilis]|uniref:N-formylglutamate amidohydrolase n=1 Tax=Dongia sp. TaxID=1977262 RepID=UPI0026EE45F3